MKPSATAETADANWRSLYNTGGVAALLMVVIILGQFVLFIAWPPPFDGSAGDWFRLFQSRPLLGLLSFELLMVVYTLLAIPVALTLYGALRRTSPSFTVLYVALTLVGAALFVTARPAFEMLVLSRQYATATDEMQQTVSLAAGEALLALFNGTSFHISYILGSLQGLIIAWIMLRSRLFGKTTAYLRIASSVLTLDCIRLLPAFSFR